MPTLTSPVTGAAQSGLTSPTYTIAADTPPSINGKQVYVSALGGTQSGVTVHSGSAPFTTAFFRPVNIKQVGKPSPSTGLIPSPAKNAFKVITRKGVLPLAGQPYSNMVVTTTIEMVAGSDLADQANVKACLSMHLGSLAQVSSQLGLDCLAGTI